MARVFSPFTEQSQECSSEAGRPSLHTGCTISLTHVCPWTTSDRSCNVQVTFSSQMVYLIGPKAILNYSSRSEEPFLLPLGVSEMPLSSLQGLASQGCGEGRAEECAYNVPEPTLPQLLSFWHLSYTLTCPPSLLVTGQRPHHMRKFQVHFPVP